MTREILWNIPDIFVTLLYAFSFLSMGWVGYWFLQRSRLWSEGEDSDHTGFWEGIRNLSTYLFFQKAIRKDVRVGVMHALLFWGFLIELVATFLVAVQHHSGFVFLTGGFYLIFSFVADLGGVMLGTGLVMALWRRRNRESLGRLADSPSTVLVLWLLLVITFTGFLVEAARISTTNPPFEIVSFVGFTISRFISYEFALQIHRSAWAFHAIGALLFIALIPLSLFRHIFLSAYSITKSQEPLGALTSNSKFRRTDFLQADSCLTCGRCTEVCPAERAGKPLSPRQIVLGIRESMEDKTSHIEDAALWSCTSCHACDSVCPVHIRILDKITTLRREKVWDGVIPGTAGEALESTAQRFNPFGKPNSQRTEVVRNATVAKEGEAIELLYWVGCAGAFDPAGMEVTKAMIHILNSLKVSYRVLGSKERCTGDPARRLGEEGLWQQLAVHNQATFSSHSVKTILTSCAHCFNAFGNEYPVLGPTPRVMHHSQWLRSCLDEGKLILKTKVSQNKITFHDPCYLARAGGEIEAPRRILDGLTQGSRVEMKACGKSTNCCGGGGGQMWLDVKGKTRVETIRAAQVEETGSRVVATACPYCRVMLEAGRTGLPQGQGNWVVRDISELVAENL